MDTGTILAVVVVALIVIGAVVLLMTKGKARRMEHKRYEASGTRDIAGATHLEAEQMAAEAEERAARAKREQLAAEQQLAEAETRRTEAQDLAERADSIDPDVRTSRH